MAQSEPTESIRRSMVIYLIVFISFVGYALTITVFPPLLMREDIILGAAVSKEMRLVLLGIAAALYPLAQFVGAPLMGAFADRHGRRPVLLSALVGTAVGYVVMIASLFAGSYTLLCIGAFVAGFFAAYIVVAQSVIADTTAPEERTRYFGYVYASIGIAFIVTPFVGGALITYLGYPFPFWCVLGLLIIAFIWIAMRFKETLKEKAEISYLQAFLNLKNVFTDKRLRGFYLINFLIYMAIFGFFRAFPMYLIDEFHLDIAKYSLFISWLNLPIVIVTIWVAKRFSPRPLLIVSSFALCTFSLAVVLPDIRSLLWVTTFFMGSAIGLSLPTSAALLSIAAKGHEQGRVMGNNQSLQVFAEGTSSLVAGFLAAIFVKLPIFVSAGFALLAALVLLKRHLTNLRPIVK